MNRITNEEFIHAVHEKLQHIATLFGNKNEQYSTGNDPLANFSRGAMLAHGRGDLIGQFEALKDYAAKHIAHVYNNELNGNKVDESINDIVLYFVIASVMSDVYRGVNND